jgi:hypothetical protein
MALEKYTREGYNAPAQMRASWTEPFTLGGR